MSYVDTPSARFLFAILKQKNLKDIDWNEVAQDPDLAQPIPNGHAARMRFSRLRTAIQGPSRPKKAEFAFKVSKPRSEGESKKKKAANQESGTATPQMPTGLQRPLRQPFVAGDEPAAHPAPAASHARLLTPCSDDVFPSPRQLDFGHFPVDSNSHHRLHHLPPTPETANEAGYLLDFAGCDHNHDHGHELSPADEAWAAALQYTSIFGPFHDPAALGSAGCDHSETEHLAGLAIPVSVAAPPAASRHLPTFPVARKSPSVAVKQEPDL